MKAASYLKAKGYDCTATAFGYKINVTLMTCRYILSELA